MIVCQECLRRYADGKVFCDECGGVLEPEVSLPRPVHPRQAQATTPPLHYTDATPALPLRALKTPPWGTTPESEQDQPTLSSMPVASPVRPRIRLRMTNGTGFELVGKDTFIVGRRDLPRDPVPDVDLADWNGAASGVSRQHAVLHVTPEGVFVEDLESRNETIHNGYRLLPRQRYPLVDGDELRLGTILLLVVIG